VLPGYIDIATSGAWWCCHGAMMLLPSWHDGATSQGHGRSNAVVSMLQGRGGSAAYRSRPATGGRRCCKDFAGDLLKKWCDATIVLFVLLQLLLFYFSTKNVLWCP
jgi:hypothetical protein